MRLRISGRGLVKISAGTGLVTLWLGLQIISTTHNDGGETLKQSQTIPELSSNLPSRFPWRSDIECKHFNTSYLEPQRCALASYPGSGSTWVRYLIEGATGVFTGSVYKDLQLQLRGYWGEMRDWRDGSTVVQKTHDASPSLVKEEFSGRGILIVRNPYDAVMSKFHYLYGGHHGTATDQHFLRSEWDNFVEIEINEWLNTALNWITNATPASLHVVHYEKIVSNVEVETGKILDYLGIQMNTERMKCLLKHKNGDFKRNRKAATETIPFNESTRVKIDQLIIELNRIMKNKSYPELPLDLYPFFKKSDSELKTFYATREKQDRTEVETSIKTSDDLDTTLDGTNMLIEESFKYFTKKNIIPEEALKVFKQLPMPKGTQVPKMLNMVVKMWPKIERSFKKDPITLIVESKTSPSLVDLVESLKLQ